MRHPTSPTAAAGSRSRVTLICAVYVMATACLSLAAGRASAEAASETGKTEPTAEPAVIPSTEIPVRAEQISERLRGAFDSVKPVAAVDQIAGQLEAATDEIERLRKAPELANPAALSPRALESLRARWLGIRDRLADWQKTLAGRSQQLERLRQDLRTLRAPWAETLNQRQELELPQPLVTRVRATLGEIDQVDAVIRDRLEAPLTLQNQIAEQTIVVNGVLDLINRTQTARLQRLFIVDSPPLWRSLVAGPVDEETGEEDATPAQTLQDELGEEVVSTWRTNVDTIWQYLRLWPDRLVAHAVLWALLCAVLLLFNRRRMAWLGEGGLSAELVDVISRPIASATLLAVIAMTWLYPAPPVPLQDLIRIVLALTVLALLWSVIPRVDRGPVFALLALYLFDVGSNLITSQAFSQRLLLFLSTLLALGVLVLLDRRARRWPSSVDRVWARAARAVIRLAIAATVASVLANLFGAVALATLLAEGTLATVYLGLGFYVLSLILRGLMEVMLRSPLLRLSYTVRRSPEVIRDRATSLIRVGALLGWAALALRAFGLLAPAWGGLLAVFGHHWQIGAFELSPGDILAFVIALWVGVVISRLVRFILTEDVFPRVHLPRGVPSTITMMVHYGIITLAFFIALAAAGFEIGRFAIVAGALGVGIGFGLQNIVNNFLSGLILAFERPIQVGDTVEVGTLLGRVRNIGIRASTVRTFDGAEVIVPNGNFISAEVINWTLSDVQRRLRLPVGVSYGSDPHQVRSILLRVAQAHPDVHQSPEPTVVFLGFGESSLDFQLLAWIDFLEGFRITTELNLAIWDALAEAGIEIPFPQRDLHLRSVTPEAGERLSPGGRSSGTTEPTQPGQAPVDTGAIRGPD